MAKAKKLPGAVKGRITKLFKSGMLLPEIKAVIVEIFPKITTERIKTVLRSHFMGLCDELWGEAVKLRDGNKCVISKKGGKLDPHHLIGRKNYNYRWCTDNGVTLASDHHTLGGRIAAHGSTDVQLRFTEWMEEHRPDQWAWFLKHKDDQTKIKSGRPMVIPKKMIQTALTRYFSLPRSMTRGRYPLPVTVAKRCSLAVLLR